MQEQWPRLPELEFKVFDGFLREQEAGSADMGGLTDVVSQAPYIYRRVAAAASRIPTRLPYWPERVDSSGSFIVARDV
jgi:hypothetical protein